MLTVEYSQGGKLDTLKQNTHRYSESKSKPLQCDHVESPPDLPVLVVARSRMAVRRYMVRGVRLLVLHPPARL